MTNLTPEEEKEFDERFRYGTHPDNVKDFLSSKKQGWQEEAYNARLRENIELLENQIKADLKKKLLERMELEYRKAKNPEFKSGIAHAINISNEVFGDEKQTDLRNLPS